MTIPLLTIPLHFDFQGVMKSQEGYVAVMKIHPVSVSSLCPISPNMIDFGPEWRFDPLPIEDQKAFEAILEVNEIAPGVKFDE